MVIREPDPDLMMNWKESQHQRLPSIQTLSTEDTSNSDDDSEDDVLTDVQRSMPTSVQVDVHVDAGQEIADTSKSDDVHAINIHQELDPGIDVYNQPGLPMFMRQQPILTCNDETMMPMKPPLLMMLHSMPPSRDETLMLMNDAEIHKEENKITEDSVGFNTNPKRGNRLWRTR